jgi:uncharacterized damage-inducible protein DinB
VTKYKKPDHAEYDEYFAGYLKHLAGDDRDVLVILEEQGRQVVDGLRKLTDQQANHRYEEQKWSVKEVIGHIIDMDRLFAFRALWSARGDKSVQPGIDENLWAANSNAHTRVAREIWDEYETARASHLQLFHGFDAAILTQTGLINGVPTTINAYPWLMAAHERHHLAVLRDRYGMKIFSE